MAQNDVSDLRMTLIDAHAHFFFLKGPDASRVKLWQILPGSLVIDKPVGAPMRKTVLGYVPTLDGKGIYEIEGTISTEPIPGQLPNTVRVEVDPSNVKKINRRLYPRVSFAPPLDGVAAAGKEEIPIRIVNFSAGGLKIESSKTLSPTLEYKFAFKVELEDEVNVINMPGTIVYELPSSFGRAYGIKFSLANTQKGEEASIETLDKTVELLGLVNKLLVREVQ